MEKADAIKMGKEMSLIIRSMRPEDVRHGMSLSTSEGWNQTENDWRLLIENPGNICIQAEVHGKVIGTTAAINYAGEEAWIGMVLVDKDHRGRGVSKALLTGIFQKLSTYPSIKLDATPAGRPVYQKFGFRDEYQIARMVRTHPNNLPLQENVDDIEPVQTKDTEEIIALDKMVFGVERRQLIEYLIKEYPAKAWLIKRNNRIAGFVLGRDGNRFHHIGPLVAFHISDAKALIARAIRTLKDQSIVVDVLFDKRELVEWLNEVGFARMRHFIRMYKENNPFPGEPGKLFLICGPEFG